MMHRPHNQRSRGGFTLVEVLAALAFLAILLPAIMSGLAISSRAGEMAERSADAIQLGENELNELMLDNTWSSAATRGDFGADFPGYRWELTQGQWSADGQMTELTLEVFFPVKGREHSIQLTTLGTATQTQTQ